MLFARCVVLQDISATSFFSLPDKQFSNMYLPVAEWKVYQRYSDRNLNQNQSMIIIGGKTQRGQIP